MFKEELYKYIAGVLQTKANEQGLKIDTSYEGVYYDADVPTAINETTGNAWLTENVDVIPFALLYDQETPSVNASDRSEYSIAYAIWFDLKDREKVSLMLENYRNELYNNKQQVIDGYNVGIKALRGDKGKTFEQGGRIYGIYTLPVYVIATKGYLFKDNDAWYIRNVTQDTTVERLPVLKETCTYQGNTNPDTSTARIIYDIDNYTSLKKFSLYYDSSITFSKELYELITLGGTSDKYALYHVFNGEQQPTKEVKIVGASREYQTNGFLILDVEFLEVV